MSDSPTSSDRTANRTSAADMDIRWALQQALGEERQGQETYDVFNYDRNPDIDDYYASFLRSRYGGPVVEIPANAAWRDPPEIEDEQDTDAETDTPFEEALAKLERRHRLWNYGNRVDVLAGIGEYGVLVLELTDINSADGFDTEAADGTIEQGGLSGLRPFSQKSIVEIETGNPGSGRWGEPVRYKLDLSDEDDDADDDDDSTMWVHHSRTVSVPSDGLLDDEVRGQPRQEGVWNTLTDIEKTLGSAAEMAYRASAWGLAINLAKDVNLKDGGEQMEKNVRDWYHGLQPVLRLQGADDIQNLGGTDIDPSPIIDPNIEALSARTGIPQKVLKGNESGEVAGSQDLQEFYGKIQERREQFVGPMVVRALVDRLVDLGVLPDPTGDDFTIEWEPLAEQDEAEEATIHLDRSKAAKNLQTVMPGMGTDDWKQFVEEGEFPDDVSAPEVEPFDVEQERQQMQDASQQPPALADGGEDTGGDGGDE